MKNSSGVFLRAIIFDLDNCLIQSTIDFKKIKSQLLQIIYEENPNAVVSRLSTQEEQDIQSFSIAELLNYIQSFSSVLHQQALRFVEEEELKGCESPVPTPCSVELLETLRKIELKMGLLTNNNRIITFRVLSSLSWLNFFDFIVTRDDVTEMKPSSEGLLFFLRQWKLKSDEVLYVGDSWIDEAAALKSGVFFIGIKRKWQPGSYHVKKEVIEQSSSSKIVWVNDLCKLKQMIAIVDNRLFLRWR